MEITEEKHDQLTSLVARYYWEGIQAEGRARHAAEDAQRTRKDGLIGTPQMFDLHALRQKQAAKTWKEAASMLRDAIQGLEDGQRSQSSCWNHLWKVYRESRESLYEKRRNP